MCYFVSVHLQNFVAVSCLGQNDPLATGISIPDKLVPTQEKMMGTLRFFSGDMSKARVRACLALQAYAGLISWSRSGCRLLALR